MPSKFTQYGGVAGADMALRQMVAERIAAEMEQRKREVENYKLQQDDRQMGQADARIGLEREQMTYGRERDTAGDQAAAAKQAQVQGFLRTAPQHMQPVLQSRSLGLGDHNQHDFEAPDAHSAHVAKEEADKRQTGLQDYEAKEQIQAKYRPQAQGPKSMGQELAEFEAKEKIKSKYAGSRPSIGAERQTLAYYNRAKQATDDIAPLEDSIAKMGLGGQMRLQMAPNVLQSDSNQSYRQAQRAFTEARLRKESGAAIPVGEYENDAKTYFAQPGDGPDVLTQKRRARAVVLDGMKNSSGKAYDEYYGQQNAPSGPVPMVAPDGRALMVPPDKVAEMEAKGAKRR